MAFEFVLNTVPMVKGADEEFEQKKDSSDEVVVSQPILVNMKNHTNFDESNSPLTVCTGAPSRGATHVLESRGRQRTHVVAAPPSAGERPFLPPPCSEAFLPTPPNLFADRGPRSPSPSTTLAPSSSSLAEHHRFTAPPTDPAGQHSTTPPPRSVSGHPSPNTEAFLFADRAEIPSAPRTRSPSHSSQTATASSHKIPRKPAPRHHPAVFLATINTEPPSLPPNHRFKSIWSPSHRVR
nr:lysine-rich arabinogalactan protein 19-like [Arachis hypogaea]